MNAQRFARYSEFKETFGIDLRKYTPKTVNNGNNGDYCQFLIDLRTLLNRNRVTSKKRIIDLMREHGFNTSLPGLSQVLTGLGIITKVENNYYIFSVNRVSVKLSEFLFSYNYFKQLCMNNSAFEERHFNDMYKHLFGKFEESIIGNNTFQTRNRQESEEDEIDEEEIDTDLPLEEQEEETPKKYYMVTVYSHYLGRGTMRSDPKSVRVLEVDIDKTPKEAFEDYQTELDEKDDENFSYRICGFEPIK